MAAVKSTVWPRFIFGVAGLGVIAAVATAIWWRWVPLPLPPMNPQDPAQVALGRSIYAANCAQCHAANLEGQPDWRERRTDGRLPAPPHDATGHSWHHPDRVLFEVTKYGAAQRAPAGYQSDMPAYEAILGDAEIAAVLAFIKSTWPPAIREEQARITLRSGRP